MHFVAYKTRPMIWVFGHLPNVPTQPDCGKMTPAEFTYHMVSSFENISNSDWMVTSFAIVIWIFLLFFIWANDVVFLVDTHDYVLSTPAGGIQLSLFLCLGKLAEEKTNICLSALVNTGKERSSGDPFSWSMRPVTVSFLYSLALTLVHTWPIIVSSASWFTWIVHVTNHYDWWEGIWCVIDTGRAIRVNEQASLTQNWRAHTHTWFCWLLLLADRMWISATSPRVDHLVFLFHAPSSRAVSWVTFISSANSFHHGWCFRCICLS